jgi:cystathionine beta-lyase
MEYDFGKVIDRRNTSCMKWDFVERVFGEKDVLPMWVADMDFEAPKPVIDAIRKRAKHGFFGYSFRSPSFYEAFINWVKKRHEWGIKREWMIISPGGVPSLNLAVMAFTLPGDKVIVQPPIYPPFLSAIKKNGRELVNNQLRLKNGQYEIDFKDLETKLVSGAKLLMFCSPHNPVGRVWKKEELMQLGKLCLKHQVVVVSDEIHGDLVFNGHTHFPLAAISEELSGTTVTFMAPSKTFNLAGLAVSAVIIPNQRLFNLFSHTMEKAGIGMTTPFGNVGFEAAYRCGEEWLEQLMKYLQGNLEFLLQYFAERIPNIKVINPEGTYLIWLNCRALKIDTKSLKNFMTGKAKVGLVNGSEFGPGGEGFQRINIACPRSLLEEGLKRIEKAVNSL